jgi:predicted Zn-dependent protease
MTARANAPATAFRVAEQVRLDIPWDVVGERTRRYEIHLQGTSIELERGPIDVEGYGIRLFRPRNGGLGTGFQASTDLTDEGIRAVLNDAEASARHAEFPAKSVELPSARPSSGSPEILDRQLWENPQETLRAYVHGLLAPFEGRSGFTPTFGSVRAVLREQTNANSAGQKVSFASTSVELELGVKASGGAEGRPPGEFWVTRTGRRLEAGRASRDVEEWCRYAADVRRAVPPPSGELPVVLPPEVLAGILPIVVGFRFTGAARLRKIAPEVGNQLGAEQVTIRDEGDYPWAPGSAPYDDEGSPTGRTTLLDHGKVSGLLYDALYASAFSTRTTGSGLRARTGPMSALRFVNRPSPSTSTLVVAPGDGGTIEELAAAAGDGVLVTQLGWASPDPVSGSFGGEIRIGYRIRGGKIAEPVRGGTVGGIVFGPPGTPSLLSNVSTIGTTPELSEDLASPPILVRPLTVAGESS